MNVIELLVVVTAGGLWLHHVIRYSDLPELPELRLPRWLLSPSDRAFRSWRIEHWIDTARSCGLRVEDISSQAAARLSVEAREGTMRVRIEAPGSPESGIRVIAVLPEWSDVSSVKIRRLASVRPQTRDLESGDESFDGVFSSEGSAWLLSALLDAETRHLLIRFQAESRLEISRGELRLETSDESLADVLPLLLDIARRLARRVDPVQRLTENALRDPDPGVRLRNLHLLLGEFSGVPGMTETLRAACSDASPKVRLRVAMELGAQGREVLLALAESLEDDACSVQAVSRLGRELPFERTRAILTTALRRRYLQTARACLEALGESGDPAAVDVITKVLAIEQGELAPAAALALGATFSPAAEPPLLLALQRETADLQAAAAWALAHTGTAAAVLPLKELARSSPNNQEIQRATRQAIAAIQSRLQGASPGQLSLAHTEAGQLSLATDPTGQLSLAPDAGEQPGVRRA